MSQALAQQLATAIDADLRAAGNSVRAASEKQYLRSDLRFYGAGIPAIRRIVTTARSAEKVSKSISPAPWPSSV